MKMTVQEMVRELETQDNMATDRPVYWVESMQRVKGFWLHVRVQSFFTRRAAEAYIEENAHNLRKPRVWVGSANRNAEFDLIVAALKFMAAMDKTSDDLRGP